MFKRFALLTLALTTVTAHASLDEKYFTITAVETKVETVTAKGTSVSVMEMEVAEGLTVAQLRGIPQDGEVKETNIGEIIKVTNDLIALGERIYKIVQAGKPVLNMSYAPISVLPKTARGEATSMHDMESWSAPVSSKVTMSYKNGYGAKVVTFDYSIIYSHSGSLEGKGAYLTAVQMIPSNVVVNWGFSLNATMKLDGIQNHGTKANPVAGAIMTMNYRVESPIKTIEMNDTYHVTGRGGLKKL